MSATMTCLCGAVVVFAGGEGVRECACGLSLMRVEERVECGDCKGLGVVATWRRGPEQIDDHETCRRCMGEGTLPCAATPTEPTPEASTAPAIEAPPEATPTPVEGLSTAYVEAMLTEALCTWLPAILRRYPEDVRTLIPWRSVDVDGAYDVARCLHAARERLGGREAVEHETAPVGATSTVSALRAVHDTLHACHALATLANAVEGRAALMVEILRRLAPVYRTAERIDHHNVKSAWSTAMEYLG